MLSVALLIFTAGMVVDFAVEVGVQLNLPQTNPGEEVAASASAGLVAFRG